MNGFTSLRVKGNGVARGFKNDGGGVGQNSVCGMRRGYPRNAFFCWFWHFYAAARLFWFIQI